MDGKYTQVHEEDQDGVTAEHPDRAEAIKRLADIAEELETVRDPFRVEALRYEQQKLMGRVQG